MSDAAAFWDTCRLWWHLVTTWPYALLWSLAVPGTIVAFLRKKRPMIPFRRVRVVMTWILDSGIAKTIERTLFCVAILSGLLLFLYAAVVIANQNARNLAVSLDSLLKVMSRQIARDAQARITLYYGDEKLDGKEIPLAKDDPAPIIFTKDERDRWCSRMHVRKSPYGLSVCQVWMHKPAANQLADAAEYVELSETMGTVQGGCKPSLKPPTPPYKTALTCYGSLRERENRLYLPIVNASSPVKLKGPIKIRITFDYGEHKAAATFTVRPPQ